MALSIDTLLFCIRNDEDGLISIPLTQPSVKRDESPYRKSFAASYDPPGTWTAQRSFIQTITKEKL